jgi:hypothetical protein
MTNPRYGESALDVLLAAFSAGELHRANMLYFLNDAVMNHFDRAPLEARSNAAGERACVALAPLVASAADVVPVVSDLLADVFSAIFPMIVELVGVIGLQAIQLADATGVDFAETVRGTARVWAEAG